MRNLNIRVPDEDYDLIKRLVPIAKEEGFITKATITNLFLEYLLVRGTKKIINGRRARVEHERKDYFNAYLERHGE